ncbi:MAG TPA: selenocysteine-specific translation elongation factor [Actinomycetota bacterium]|nr:selenocysteine-specific translation elongation factor [Actinomycetota bacterium]
MHVIGTAGHVDHGKSTLVQRLTGMDPDRFAEEKARGLTIDLGFAWMTLPSGVELGIVDVPGHERFIKNMLAGAGGITLCLFVVAANEGWKPQSAEHLAILDVLGISHGVVALTKSDTVEPAELDQVATAVKQRLAPSSLANASVIPCSATTGEGIDDLIAAVDELVSHAPPAADRARPRLWIDRVFTIAGAGTVVTGTLAGGRFTVGDEVEITPQRHHARVRSIQNHKKQVQEIGPGNRVALNLAGIDRDALARGQAVVKPGAWRVTSRMDCLIQVLDPAITGADHRLEEKGAHLLYAGSAETPVRLKLLDGDAIAPGASGYAQLLLRDPLPLARGDRFVLRDAGRILTFGGGVVVDPLAPAARRGDRDRVELLSNLARTTDAEAVAALVGAEGMLEAADATARIGSSELPAEVSRLGSVLVSSERLVELQDKLRAVLATYHAANPLERGMPRTQLRVALDVADDVFEELLVGTRGVVPEAALVRLAAHEVELDPEQKRVRGELLARINRGAFSPPLASELDVAPGLLRALVDSGELVKVGNFYLTTNRAIEARSTVRAEIVASGPLTVAAIRDLLKTSRKYAVPLCEWLDSTGATRRQGDLRVLGPTP